MLKQTLDLLKKIENHKDKNFYLVDSLAVAQDKLKTLSNEELKTYYANITSVYRYYCKCWLLGKRPSVRVAITLGGLDNELRFHIVEIYGDFYLPSNWYNVAIRKSELQSSITKYNFDTSANNEVDLVELLDGYSRVTSYVEAETLKINFHTLASFIEKFRHNIHHVKSYSVYTSYVTFILIEYIRLLNLEDKYRNEIIVLTEINKDLEAIVNKKKLSEEQRELFKQLFKDLVLYTKQNKPEWCEILYEKYSK